MTITCIVEDNKTRFEFKLRNNIKIQIFMQKRLAFFYEVKCFEQFSQSCTRKKRCNALNLTFFL